MSPNPNWLLDAAQRFRQRVEYVRPPRDPKFDPAAPAKEARCPECGDALDAGTQTVLCLECRPKRKHRPCIVEGCDRKAKHGLRCRLHRNGDPEF